jgi:catechol 2,3-dioxygenase-like lactoylglutathione lyase family enzyme
MTNEPIPPWTIRSTLIAVTDLERSVAFYRDIGPFDEVVRDDAIAVLGDPAPSSIMLILREARGPHHTRHGQQSLGLRSITFNVGDPTELDRIESVLRDRDLLTTRRSLADGVSDLVLGHDPDNLPLLFVYYADDTVDADYYRVIADSFYTMDT